MATHKPTTFSSEIKAIETRWNGYRFRSRTEARWAVLLSNLGIKYEYEHEGFVLASGERYLPDFYLPDLRAVLEVKPTPDADFSKVEEFARQYDEGETYVAVGAPRSPGTSEISLVVPKRIAGFAECPCCGVVSIATDGTNAREWLSCRCLENVYRAWRDLPKIFKEHVDWGKFADNFTNERVSFTPKILFAFEVARSARFEHGESPEVPR